MMSLLDPLPSRVLVVVAHSDDETIGAGILLSRLADARVLHLTNSAPRDERFIRDRFSGTRDEYEQTRRRELAAAMELAGVGPDRLLRIEGVADQEAVQALPRLARELAVLFRQLRPEVVITHAYEGGHPDHDAAVVAVRTAAELVRRGRGTPPEIFEMALYHAHPGGDDPVVQEFLPPTDRVEVLELSEEEKALKQRMLDAFDSQKDLLALFRPPAREVFRPAPRIDISRPPHEGRLQYEIWGFPIDSARWRDLARDAVEELEMPGWRG